jgi:hypothetical protein
MQLLAHLSTARSRGCCLALSAAVALLLLQQRLLNCLRCQVALLELGELPAGTWQSAAAALRVPAQLHPADPSYLPAALDAASGAATSSTLKHPAAVIAAAAADQCQPWLVPPKRRKRKWLSKHSHSKLLRAIYAVTLPFSALRNSSRNLTVTAAAWRTEDLATDQRKVAYIQFSDLSAAAIDHA